MKPSVRAASGPSLMTWSRHFHSSLLPSTPRFSVMFDHLIGPMTFRMTGLPFASIEVLSITEFSESRP
jgi:hypothetical protein